MGCDIHMYVEYKIPGDKWTADKHHKKIDKDGYCVSVTATGRNYDLFGLLASVRNNGPRNPKDLPKDVSPEIKAASDYWGGDGHSHSWLSLKEFKKILFEEYSDDEHKYKPTDNINAFYRYEDFRNLPDYKNSPPNFTTLVAYCEHLIDVLNVDRIILDDEQLSSPVKVRLVFWFDN